MTQKRGRRRGDKKKPELMRCKFRLPGKDSRFFFGVVVQPHRTLSTVLRDNGRVYQLDSGQVWVERNVSVAARAHGDREE